MEQIGLAPHGGCWWEYCKICNTPTNPYPQSWRQTKDKGGNVSEEVEINVVNDTCDECGETVWYDANDGDLATYCDDEDLAVEHECDHDYDEEEED